MYRKILVPLDGSKLAEAVLPQVRVLADTASGEIVLLRVPDYPIFDQSLTDPELITQIQRQADSDARAYLDAVARDLQGNGRKISCVVVNGAVADTILDWAERTGADLIAMSTHGRGGMARWLIGSVTDKVVQGARVPVLVVRPARVQD